MTILQLLNSINLLTALFCQHHIIKDVASLNVALNKSATDCNRKPLSKIMFDGDTNQNISEITNESCMGSEAYVHIDLGGMYYLHYAVVYAGSGAKIGQLNYFRCYVGEGDILVASSEFWGPSVIPGKGMRVNFEASDTMASKVRIQSRVAEVLSISEIEVHTLASGLPGEVSKFLRGCFRKFGNSIELHETPLFARCRQNCITRGYIFFGIKNNIACHCGGDYDDDDEIPLKTCDVYCDNGLLCGSRAAFSVYLASVRLPSYRGCIIRSESILKSKIQGSMTIAKCLYNCDNYFFALLKDGNSCFCFNGTITLIGSRYELCNKECSGNPNEICGGERYLSTYRTCLNEDYASVRCSKLFQCDGSYDMYGSCKDGCKQGFWGEHCLEGDPTLLSPSECLVMNPCLNKINTGCSVQNGIVKCECLNGFVRSNEFSECEDVDECLYEPCDTRNAVCINTNGTYICNCLPGFFMNLYTDICIDNTTVGDERFVDHLKYWMMIAYLSPLLTVLFLMMIMCLYSPGRTESEFRHSKIWRSRKVSYAGSMASTWTKASGKKKILP